MKELLYYSIFAIILYFVLTQVFENFNIEQENFDPSLVPVSSIVTLAKVAQKLVNGNGTLTNPGNLQIGASASAPGYLTVTGNIQANGGVNSGTLGAGKIQIGNWAGRPAVWANDTDNPLTIHNDGNKTVQIGASTTYPSNLVVTGSASINGALMANNNLFLGNKAMLHSGADPFANDGWVRLMKADGSAAYSSGFSANNLYSQQDTTVNRNLSVTGSILNGGLTLRGGAASPDSTIFGFGDGSGWRARFGKVGSPTLDVYDNAGGGVQVTGKLSATANIDINAGTGNNGINIKSGNPYIAFNRTGSAGVPQLYSDGTTLHAYNAPFQADSNLTVSGLTSVNGGLHLNNAGANFIRINKGVTPDANTINIWKGDPGLLTFVGINAAGNDYSWPGVVLDTRNSKVTTNTLQVNGNATISGSLASTSIRFTASEWTDVSFLNGMAKYFSKDEPEGTTRLFMIRHPNGDTYRFQYGVKMPGNQIWRYPLWLNGGDCGGCDAYPSNGNDGWRKAL